MSEKILLDAICYLGTLLTLVSYCFRTVKLRVFVICGNIVNIIWAILDNQQAILISNLLYLSVNAWGLRKELKVHSVKKDFRSLSPVFKDGLFHCNGYSAKTEKELISILKKQKIL